MTAAKDVPTAAQEEEDLANEDAREGAEGDVKKRGRKRGKHNFEPGYKDLLYDEWNDFTTKNRRCPKPEEVLQLSEQAFRTRREALLAEDVNHPHLSILESPLDAIQVKNLVNNEKRRRSKLASHGAGGACDTTDMYRDDVAGPGPGSVAANRTIDTTPPPTKRLRTALSPHAESEADSQSQNTAATGAAAAGISSLLGRLQAGRHQSESTPSSILGSHGLSGHGSLGSFGSLGMPSGLDVNALQENLQHLLASQLQKMNPQQQLALWQMHQQQQQQQAQQPALQQALSSLLGMQAPAPPMSIPGIPGMYNNLSLPHSLLATVLQQPQPQATPQPMHNPLSAFTSFVPTSSPAFGSSISPASGLRPDSTLTYQQMLQLVQMMQSR